MMVRLTLFTLLVSTTIAHAEGLDRAAISAGIASVKAKVVACGDASPKASGKVKARVTVAPEGKVTNVEIEATPEPKLGACVAGVLQKTTFKKTSEGGSFSYPFVFTAKGDAPASPPPSTPGAPPPAPAPAKTGLDRAMISEGIAKVKTKIADCGTGQTAKGVVKVSVSVKPEGTVASAKVTQTPSDPLGACVARVLEGATFARTEAGGSFSYPFVF